MLGALVVAVFPVSLALVDLAAVVLAVGFLRHVEPRAWVPLALCGALAASTTTLGAVLLAMGETWGQAGPPEPLLALFILGMVTLFWGAHIALGIQVDRSAHRLLARLESPN